MYRPDVRGDENDDREGAKPCVSDGEQYITRDLRAGEVPEREYHHAHRQRQRDQIEHPHLSLQLPLRLRYSTREDMQRKRKANPKERSIDASFRAKRGKCNPTCLLACVTFSGGELSVSLFLSSLCGSRNRLDANARKVGVGRSPAGKVRTRDPGRWNFYLVTISFTSFYSCFTNRLVTA